MENKRKSMLEFQTDLTKKTECSTELLAAMALVAEKIPQVTALISDSTERTNVENVLLELATEITNIKQK